MRTPLWESSPGALAALLNSAAAVELVWCDLFTLTLAGGTVYRWSGTDIPITVNGITWSLGPGIVRGKLRRAVGIQVDTLEVKLYADSSITIAGTPLIQYIARGGLDNARLQADRAFKLASDVGIVGTVNDFTGRIATVKPDREQAVLQVKSDTELLDVMVPREVYQPGCTNTLYDSACGVNRAALTVTGTATAVTDATRITFGHALGQAAAHFDLGVVTFTSGLNAGIARTVKRHVSGQITVLSPLPFAVAIGDAFSIYPGCDKTQATCTSKFNNVIRFRGHPYIPTPETIT
jgi:uncharacterized phage protein (TIGR02218 family)